MLKWIGKEKGMDGIPGIPGRDLSDEEIKKRGLDVKMLVQSGLYVEEKPKKESKSMSMEVSEHGRIESSAEDSTGS